MWCEECTCWFVWVENKGCLSGLRIRLFVWVENKVVCLSQCISCRYDWMFSFAMFMSLCVDVMMSA